MATIAIMQSAYLPWLGYFDLMDQVDQFVLLDNVAFSHQSWQHRNRIRTRNGLDWLTVPVRVKGRFGQRISEVEIDGTAKFPRSHVGVIESSYGKAKHYCASAAITDAIGAFGAGSMLHQLTESLIEMIANLLGITTPIVRSSNLPCAGQRSELLVAICKQLGADRYVSPPGAVAYLREDATIFEQAGISVAAHQYEHPEYEQRFAPFLSHASVIDAMFNLGPGSACELLRSGRRPSVNLDDLPGPLSDQRIG